jgi:hypothetical protein
LGQGRQKRGRVFEPLTYANAVMQVALLKMLHYSNPLKENNLEAETVVQMQNGKKRFCTTPSCSKARRFQLCNIALSKERESFALSLSPEPEKFALVIEALPSGKNWQPVNSRLRSLLKSMLRAYGFKLREISPTASYKFSMPQIYTEADIHQGVPMTHQKENEGEQPSTKILKAANQVSQLLTDAGLTTFEAREALKVADIIVWADEPVKTWPRQ